MSAGPGAIGGARRVAGLDPRRAPIVTALAVCAISAVAFALLEPKTADLAAQTFRARLWETGGFVLWNAAWYGGHTIPGYSLLYPPLGALVGPSALGIVCALGSTALFGTIARRAFPGQAWLGTVWFGLAATVALWGSRVTFALGVTIGLASLLALQRGRPVLATVLAAFCGLASPVAGLFCALAAAAVLAAARIPLGRAAPALRGLPERGAVGVALGAGLATLAVGLAFPVDGREPFRLALWVWIPATAIVTLALVPREQAVIRWGALLYAVLGTAAFAIETPLGDNAVRLGYTFAGPVLALALAARRPLLLALLAVPLLYWQWNATANDVYHGLGSPTAERSFHQPLLEQIDRHARDRVVRVHVPPTRTRWEAVHVAAERPLARGWLRQLESDDFASFRDGALDAESYEAWLRENGVSYVALTGRAELDYMAEHEARLLRGADLPFLTEIWSSRDWRLWAVREEPPSRGASPDPLGGEGIAVTALAPDRWEARVDRPGEYRLAIGYTPYLRVTSGPGCIEPVGSGEATRLVVDGAARWPANVTVEASISPRAVLGIEGSC